MTAKFNEFPLRIINPSFESELTDSLIELNHLRRLRLEGSTPPWIFFQLKYMFHMLESIGSARIEGNRTTISDYVEQSIFHTEKHSEDFAEIKNIQIAMDYIESEIDAGSHISHKFIRELHAITVNELNREGDKTPGQYRDSNVLIAQSKHLPPENYLVQSYMDELLSFINKADANKYELLKVALAHHRFSWIHPFTNGNGRVVRLLTYALLIKYGFNIKEGQLINPTAVFCNNREQYYKYLSIADGGTDEGLLEWCGYVLNGIYIEINKVNKLLNYDYLKKEILIPTIKLSIKRSLITDEEGKFLIRGINKETFSSSELFENTGNLTSRQKSHIIQKLKEAKFIRPLEEKSRKYHVNFINNYLTRSLVILLEQEGFIPPINS